MNDDALRYESVDLIDFFNQLVARHGSQKETAKYLGISQQYLTDLIRGRRLPGEDLLDRMGLQKVVLYFPKESDHE